MRPAPCGRAPARRILRVPASTESALTVLHFTEEPLIDRLRRATIGRYDVYAELGAGGMATVFLALDLALDRKVAIKVMSPALMSSPGAIERFRREARVAAALSHPHIVPIHAIGEEPGLAYYVMKWVEGRSLDSVLRAEGRQEIAFVQALLGYVGSALHYAHQRGVVHRDVKPANIMLDREGWCYVTDFGIAQADDGAVLTKSGVIIGTPHYMCPEQFNGQPITGAADQYALGIVAFELLTGRPPYGGPTVGEMMRGHLLEPVPPVRLLRPDVPEAIEACVMRMLAKDVGDRYASVADAVAAFGTVSATAERGARALIAELAEKGVGEQPVMSVPTSPVAQRRPTVHARVISANTTPLTSPVQPRPMVPESESESAPTASQAAGRSRLVLLLGLGAVAVAAWVSTSSRAGEGTAVTSAPAPITADSTVVPGTRPTITSGAPVASNSRVPSPADTRSPASVPQRDPRDGPGDGAARPETAGKPAVEPALVRIGSRIPLAVLYVNGSARGVIGQQPAQDVSVPPGRVQLSIRAENCQNWDTTFVAPAAGRITIGFRGPKCGS